MTARSWPERERNLCTAYEAVASLHNGLGLTASVDATVRQFHDRPFQVIGAERFVAALRDSITSEEIRGWPLTGAVDQFIDSTDALVDPRLPRAAIAAQLPLRELSIATASGYPSYLPYSLRTNETPPPRPTLGPGRRLSGLGRLG